MSEQSTAIARATSELDNSNHNSALAVMPDAMTPEVFQARIEREKQMRKIFRDYVKDNMKEGYHYDTHLGNLELAKPRLNKNGVANICSLFKIYFGAPEIVETHLADGHFRARTHIKLYNQAGNVIATGDAVCSTLETKYAFRKGDRVCPECDRDSTIIKGKTQYGGGWVCYERKGGCGAKFDDNDTRITDQQLGRVDNPDKADSENTVLKMSIIRAENAAVCRVPMVSEIFAPEDDEASPKSQGPRPKAEDSRRDAKGQSQSPQAASADKNVRVPEDDPAELEELRGKIKYLLTTKIGSDDDDIKAFLKGRDPEQMNLEALRRLQGDLASL